MATKKIVNNKVITTGTKSKGELNRGQGVRSKGELNRGQGTVPSDIQKKRETRKNMARVALRIGTMGYDAMVSDAVKKAKVKKAAKKAAKK